MTPLTADQLTRLTSALPEVIRDEPMSKHTNFRIGGPARLYFVANDADALIRAVQAAEEVGVPWTVFGGGSNLLVADSGYEGLVIQSALRQLIVENHRIHAGSGVITALAARKAADASLAGFEWAIGVPGTIGGAVYGNAGCYGGEMKDVVDTVDAYRLSDHRRVQLSKSECAFDYRESIFKKERYLILGCTLALTDGNADVSKKRMQEIVETRKAKQPLEQSSAGCAFKNFAFSDEAAIRRLRNAVDIPEEMIKKGVISAGWLVNQVDALGMKVGNITVSEKHGNFLVNVGGGRAQDVVALMSLVKAKIRDEFSIMLTDEVQLLGFE